MTGNEVYEKFKSSSKLWFGNELVNMGMGGSIPFVGTFADRFPTTLLLVTGVAGPNNNAHSPDENLHLEYLEKFLGSMVSIFSEE